MSGKELGWRDPQPLHDLRVTTRCASDGREPQAAALQSAVGSASDLAQALHVLHACSECREYRNGTQSGAERGQSLTGGLQKAIGAARRMANASMAELRRVERPQSGMAPHGMSSMRGTYIRKGAGMAKSSFTARSPGHRKLRI